MKKKYRNLIRVGYTKERFNDLYFAQIDDPFQRLLSSLNYRNIVSNNCFSINNLIGKKEIISSPFVTAIAGLILSKINRHPFIENCLEEIRYHLIRCIRSDCVINFFENSEHNHDLDTYDCVNLFLLSENPNCIRRDVILDTIVKNKCHTSGAYKTWIDREDNQIDYFVNINVYVLLSKLSYEDKSLCDFLKSNIYKFLSEGSRYYEKIEFPLFLIFFYLRNQFVKPTDKVFSEIIYNVLKNHAYKSIVDKFFQFYSRNDNIIRTEGSGYKFPQYFNSSSGSFHSPILDSIINAYLFCQRHNHPDMFQSEYFRNGIESY